MLLVGVKSLSQPVAGIDTLVGKTIKVYDIEQIHVRDDRWHFMSYRAESEIEVGNWKVVDNVMRDGLPYIRIIRNNYGYWIHLGEESRWAIVEE